MRGSRGSSTNVVDQLLGHTRGPSDPVTDRDVKRTRSSAYIVHGNFRRLDRMCDDVEGDGLVSAKRGSNSTDVTNEVYRRVHNYVSSLYSFNEQVRDVLAKRLNEEVEKRDFLPTRNDRGAPAYTRRLAFLWGIRNDFQHGDYWCLKVEHETRRSGYDQSHLHFRKRYFNATPEGDLDAAGEYLAHASDGEQRYPLPYIGEFHRKLFSEFEQDFEAWCGRNRA